MQILDQEIAKKVAGYLLDIKAIKLSPEDPFKWSSGWNSPIYCDNRLSLSFPKIRSEIKEHLADGIKKMFPEVESIAGVATAGIPQGALVADILDIPFIYVRSKPKGHGMENMIEGKVTPGQKVVLIEDLISTGGSSLKAAEALRASNYEVLGMGAIFTYGFDIAEKNFEEAGVDAFCLSNYNQMLGQAQSMGYIQPDQLETLSNWRENPDTWKA
ncbi:MAG: orotate phosphoribosyltransferase [bacterium]|nr:orotate phosphoribosyltransferase [bacterium]